MTRVFRWRWLGSSVATWLVLAAVNTIAPVQAQAGCSHPWVQTRSNSVSPPGRRLLESALHPSLAGPGSTGSSDRRDPCAGRACSRSPDLPVSSPIQILPENDQWGDVPAEAAHSLPHSRIFSLDDDRPHPSRFPKSIERPPRLMAAR
jgi:hypothetical protein